MGVASRTGEARFFFGSVEQNAGSGIAGFWGGVLRVFPACVLPPLCATMGAETTFAIRKAVFALLLAPNQTVMQFLQLAFHASTACTAKETNHVQTSLLALRQPDAPGAGV
jgi:hypothetical protein